MISSRCRELVKSGDGLFSKRSSLLSYWQDIAAHFYPERADFTQQHSFGDDFASHLMTGFPAMQLRELADQLATMLRPRQKLWATLMASDERVNEDSVAKQWLEQKSEVMRRMMYAKDAHFLRATKIGDKDFMAFGQCVIQVRLNRQANGLLYINRHLRDTVWCENADFKIDTVHRKENMPARVLCQTFGDKVHQSVKKIEKEDPYKEIKCRHIVVSSDQYEATEDGKKYNRQRFPFLSIYLDEENDTILEEVPQTRLGYIIPRWSLGAVGQYAMSPATMLGLPDARLLQQMTVSLLEAAEKSVNAPIVARAEVVRSDIQMYANGVTWLDFEDGKVSDYLQAMQPDISGQNYGLQMLMMVEEKLKQIFYLNKLHLPELNKDMTAFETNARLEEYRRGALPLFEPMETEYNGAICEDSAQLLIENGAFGPPDLMPESLRGAELRFEFESPLQATAERAKVTAFHEVLGVLAPAMQIDPGSLNEADLRKMVRDAIGGTMAPEEWKRDPKMVEHLDKIAAQKMAAQNAMAQVAGGAEIAGNAGKAVKEFAAAGM